MLGAVLPFVCRAWASVHLFVAAVFIALLFDVPGLQFTFLCRHVCVHNRCIDKSSLCDSCNIVCLTSFSLLFLFALNVAAEVEMVLTRAQHAVMAILLFSHLSSAQILFLVVLSMDGSHEAYAHLVLYFPWAIEIGRAHV